MKRSVQSFLMFGVVFVMVFGLSGCKDTGDTFFQNQPPTVEIGENRTVTIDKSITLTGDVIDKDGNIVSYQWSEGDEILATTSTFTYVPTTTGEHTLTLTVMDDSGNISSDTLTIIVKEINDVDDGGINGIDNRNDTEGDSSSSDKSDGGNDDDNDNSNSNDKGGDDTDNGEDESGKAHTIGNKPPIAEAGEDKSITVNHKVIVVGEGKDSDGIIIFYQWKEGDTVLSDSASFSYTPTTVGEHTLTLTVTDDDGATGSDTMTVTAKKVIGSGGGGSSGGGSSGGGTSTNQSPTADAGEDKSVTVNQTVTITGTGTDSDGTIIAYQWKEGDTVLSDSASFSYTPTTVGEHTLTLTVTDDDGATGSDTMKVTVSGVVGNQSPTADAGEDKSVTVNQTVTITGTGTDSDGTITAYQWKEGDTVLSDSASFSYTPTTVGEHTLTLTVTDDDGATGSDTMKVTVSGVVGNQSPTADAGEDKSVTVNQTVTITGTGTDSDGTITAYQWKEGDTVLSDSASFSYTPTTVGEHTLTLTVTDDDGATGSDTMKVTVSGVVGNQSPTADAGEDKSVTVNQTVTITGTGTDSDGTITAYQWKEGDTVLSDSASFSYTPTTVGEHTLTLTVTDDDGATGSDTMKVTVSGVVGNQSPTADAGEDKSVTVNQTVTITGTGTDSDGTITAYQWKEGDTVLSDSASFSYTPTTVGEHTLTLTVTDDDGATGSDTMKVTVSGVVGNQSPTADAGEDKSVTVNQTVTITGTGTDSDGTITAYQWKEGDTVLSDSASFSYTPTTVGEHTLTLTVTDDDGATGSDTMKVTVSGVVGNQSPTADAGEDKSVTVNQTVTITGTGTDSDGTITAYQWKEGDTVLSDSASFSYTPTTVGEHTLTLTVTDDDGATGSDTMKVTVSGVVGNQSPTADAGEDKSVTVNQTVTITGTGTDSDGTITAYQWKEGDTVLSDSASFSYTPTTVGEHTLTLTVTDDDGATGSDTMKVTVSGVVGNQSPTADAGEDKSVTVNQTVTITGTGTDSDGTITAYQWKEGDTVLSDSASFSYTPTTVGEHTLTLTVTDDDGATGSDTMKVTVSGVVGNQSPTADAGEDKSVTVNQTVTITGTGTDSDGTITAYQWKEGDTVLSDSASFSYTPTTVGEHTLTLTVTDDDGATGSDTMKVTASEAVNQSPTADAGEDKSVTVNQTVTITGTGTDSDGTIIAYQWKEGDTVLSDSASFSYTPTTVGEHTLTLTVTDDDGATGSDTMKVTASEAVNQSPTADAGEDKNVTVNQTVTITGTGTDSDGTITAYQWKEGDTVLSDSASFSYTPTTVGEHTLTLTVTDDDGATGSDTMKVTASEAVNQSPTADAGEDKSVTVNQTVTITGTGTDSDGTITAYQWKEGDTVLSDSASFSYTPTTVGEHTLTLTVTDDDGATGSDTMKVTASEAVNQSPTADAGEDKNVTINQTVTITGTGTDSDGTITAYQWKEGDTVLSDSASFSYTPTTVGEHTLTLIVTDDDGATGSDTMKVTASEAVNQSPTADAGEDKSVTVNQTVTITGTGTDSDGTITAYQWKEGDTVLSNSASLFYIATSVGEHILTLTVTDDDGATDSDTMKVTITGLPLIIIRIEFNDYSFKSDVGTWSDKIFGESDGQLNHYLKEVSYGKFLFEKANESDGDFDGIITVHLNENHPNTGSDGSAFLSRILTAVDLADEYIDFSQYDTDKNGKISNQELQIMFLVAGGESATGASPGIWAHQWCFYGGNASAPTLDGVKLMDCMSGGNYSRFGEKHFNADSGSDATIGVIAHELGHAALGLPDLYDTDGSSNGIGNFGLMGGGAWGRKTGGLAGATPVHLTGWSKIRCNFVTPNVVTNGKALQLGATSSLDYQLIKVPTDVATEYFLLENRAASGYDLGLQSLVNSGDYSGGLLILHIDDSKTSNSDETHKLVDVEEANNPGLDSKTDNGRYDNLFYLGNQDNFTPTTDPNSNTYSDGDSGVNITNISDRGSVMSLDIETN